MKIKYYLLFICLFFLSGCSANYQLNIDKNLSFNETVIMNASDNEDISLISSYEGYLPINVESDDTAVFEKKIDNVEYYDLKKNKDNSKMKFSYNFDLTSLNKSMIAASCFKHIAAINNVDDTENKNELILSTSKGFLCFDKYENLDDVTVVLYSKYQEIQTNADVIDGHQYIWNIDRENAKDKYIYLSLDMNKKNLNLWE